MKMEWKWLLLVLSVFGIILVSSHYNNRIMEFQNRINELESQQRELQDENNQLKSQIDELQSTIENKTKQIEYLQRLGCKKEMGKSLCEAFGGTLVTVSCAALWCPTYQLCECPILECDPEFYDGGCCGGINYFNECYARKAGCLGYYRDGSCTEATIEEVQAYTCPTKEEFNCMPSVIPENMPYCSGPYHEWIVENCPNISFSW